jgi:protein-tyrosine-phosphatase
MAEGFARAHGRGVWEADSAGLMPAAIVAPLTRRVMEEKNISLDEHFPKGLDEVRLSDYGLVVNMSGYEMPGIVTAPVRTWDVRDPIGQSDKVYREVRDQIERLVLGLLSEVRARAGAGR